MLYTGVDYHKSFSYLTTMNEKGEVLARRSYPVMEKLLISLSRLASLWR